LRRHYVYEDPEKGKFAVLTDIAQGLRKDAVGRINKASQQIDALQDLLKNGQETSIDVSGGFGNVTNLGRTPLLASERARVLPRLTNARAQLSSEEAGLRAIENRIADAEKFAGTPMFKKAVTSDPVVDPAIKVLSLSNVTKRELKTKEVKTERPLTSDEKLAFVTTEFIKKGGVLTPTILSDLKTSTKSNVEVYYVDGVTFVQINGGAAMAFDRRKALTAGLSTIQSKEAYQKNLTTAARIGFNNLSDIDKNTLAEGHGLHGDKNSITGKKFPLTEIINARSNDFLLGKQASEETLVIPKTSPTGVPSSLSRFKIEQ